MSLVETLTGLITPQITGALASRLGESDAAVKKGLLGGAGTLLSALAGRSSDTGLFSALLGLINGPGAGGLLSGLGSIASGGGAAGDLGGKLLGLVLGSNQSAIGSAIASAAGLKSSSASGILGMAAPMVLGMLGQRVKDGGLNASGLASMLSKESSALSGLVPAGVGSLLSNLSAPSMPSMPSAPQVEEQGSSWLMPALIAALLLGGFLWYMNQGKDAVKEVASKATETASSAASSVSGAATQATSAVAGAANAAWAALGEFFKRKLPNGFELNIPKLGVENRLVDFIEDATKAVDKTTWFDFDRLLFDTGKSTLQPASQEQLENIAQIMKAFPNVHIKLGGYTDNVGDKAANMKLSQDRANTVMAELVKLGVDAGRLTAEGYGDQHPVASNDTEEGRQKNRRISMRIAKK